MWDKVERDSLSMRSGWEEGNRKKQKKKQDMKGWVPLFFPLSLFLFFSFLLLSIHPTHTYLPSLPAPSRSPPFSKNSCIRLIHPLYLCSHSTTRLPFCKCHQPTLLIYSLSHTHAHIHLLVTTFLSDYNERNATWQKYTEREQRETMDHGAGVKEFCC